MHLRRPASHRPIATLGITIGVVATLAACSGDDDASATTPAPPNTGPAATSPPDPTSTVPATTTTAAPTTTQAPTTNAAGTTSKTTVATTTTPSTSSTIPEAIVGIDNPRAQAMLAAFDDYYEAFTQMGEDPTDDELVDAVLVKTSDGVDGLDQDQAGFVRRYVDIARRDGLAVRRNTELPSDYIIIEPSISVTGPFGGLDICEVDGDTTVEVGANADGSDRIVAMASPLGGSPATSPK